MSLLIFLIRIRENIYRNKYSKHKINKYMNIFIRGKPNKSDRQTKTDNYRNKKNLW